MEPKRDPVHVQRVCGFALIALSALSCVDQVYEEWGSGSFRWSRFGSSLGMLLFGFASALAPVGSQRSRLYIGLTAPGIVLMSLSLIASLWRRFS